MAHRRRGNSEGTISQLPSGSFRAQVTLQGHRLSFTAKNRRECQQWIRQTRDQIDLGMSYAATKLMLGDYLSDWLAMKKPIFRTSTWSYYKQLIQTYISPNIGSITLKDLRTTDIQSLYSRLVNQQVGVPTIQKIHKLLHSSLATAEETGIITRNPTSFAHPPKGHPREMMILKETQVSDFLFAIQGHKWEALFHLAIASGMRRNELLALKWEDLDWVQQSLQVKRQLSKIPQSDELFQPLKTNSSKRSIALGDETIRLLRDHYEHQWSLRLNAGIRWVDYGLIFTNSYGGPICASHMVRVFKDLLKHTGVPEIRFHDLRHTAASLMINHGVPPVVVAQRLGHSKTSTTLDVYSHLMDGQQKIAAKLMDELITPVKLHTNCTRMHTPDQNAIESEKIAPHIAENITDIV